MKRSNEERAIPSGGLTRDAASGGRLGKLGPVVASAAGWVVLSRIASQTLRLGSNLVLTRILFPEAFGLMAIVQSLIDGLRMFSDVGVGLSVVQHERGNDPEFLDTAWTTQAIRGVAVAGIAALLAWPLAAFYGDPLLRELTWVAALSAIVSGLSSMSLFLLQRELHVGKLVRLELGTQTATVAITIALAWATGSVWALVVGTVVGASLRTAVSHIIGESPRHRFHLDRDARGSIYRFGRWVFLTTPFAYLMNQGDRLLVGAFFAMGDLGVYAIGALLARAFQQLATQLFGRVVFPVYAAVGKETTPAFQRRVGRLRLAFLAVFVPPLCAVIVFGDLLIELLYDDRYHGAGWVLRVLSAGMLFWTIGRVGPIHLARGESLVGLVTAAVPALSMLAAMAVGTALYGPKAAVVAIAFAYVMHYPMEVWVARRYDLWMPRYDLAGFALAGVLVGLGLWLR